MSAHVIRGFPAAAHQMVILSNRGPMATTWDELGIKVDYLNILNLSDIGFYTLLRQFFLNRKFDRIIYWSIAKLSLVITAAAPHCNVMIVHLGNPFPYSKLSFFKERSYAAIGRLSALSNVRYIACSHHVASTYQNRAIFNYSPIQVVYNAIGSTSAPVYHVQRSRSDLQLGMVARLDPIKNHYLLIEAFDLAFEENKSLRLHLVGAGSLMDALRKKVSLLPCEDRIAFHGEVSNPYEHLRSWDAFVYSTTLKEGLGSSVLEAMGCGLPCVLPNLPMLKEVGAGQEGILWFKADSASSMAAQIIQLSKLLADRSEAFRISKSLFAYASDRFSAERVACAYLIDRNVN